MKSLSSLTFIREIVMGRPEYMNLVRQNQLYNFMGLFYIMYIVQSLLLTKNSSIYLCYKSLIYGTFIIHVHQYKIKITTNEWLFHFNYFQPLLSSLQSDSLPVMQRSLRNSLKVESVWLTNSIFIKYYSNLYNRHDICYQNFSNRKKC